MEGKIYKKSDVEYKADGHLLIDGQNYLTVKIFKEKYYALLSDEIENHTEINSKDSDKIALKLANYQIKMIEPIEGGNKYIRCFPLEGLKTYYEI